MKHWNLLIVFWCLGILHLSAQRALPGFTVEELSKGKISISWINPYPSCNQLAIQRSTDSINFRTIFSAQSPELPRNGYIDNKVPIAPKVYYRIFYVLAGGSYFFTEIKSGTAPNKETADKDPIKKQEDIAARITLPTEPIKETVAIKDSSKNEVVEKTIKIYKRGSFLYQFNVQAYKNFRDSIIQYTQDSLTLIKPGEINWKPFMPKPKEYVSVFVKEHLTGTD